MTIVRKTGGRDEIDAIIAFANAMLVDLTAVRTALLGGLDRGQNGVLTLNRDTDTLADLTELRTQLAACVVDLGVIHAADLLAVDRVNNGVLGRSPMAKVYADLVELRTQMAAGVVDLGVLRASAVLGINRGNATCFANPAIADGTADGKIQNVNAVDFSIAGRLYSKAATDDLWDLTGQTDTTGTEWVAFWLYLDASGTATIAAGTVVETSEAGAIAALPAIDDAKCPVGVYVAGNSCDFDGAAGLTAQGTLINGRPAAQADPAAVTATTPAALTSAATLAGIVDGTTDGALQTSEVTEFQVNGQTLSKAATDDLWDMNAETDTAADKYRAYWLYLSAAGAASSVAGTDADSEALALAALPAEDAAKCPIGVFVAGLACDFDGAAGLAAQGTILNGRPAAVADPAAVTATTPAALDTEITVGVVDGTTAGNLAISSDVDFQIGGQMYEKAETDDLWDLSAEVDTAADKYRAYRLYLDASGTATFEASTADAASAVLALAALPDESATKCPIAIFVAGLSTDFDDVGGLAAQGSLYDGRYSAVADPAALTAAAITSVAV